MNHYAHTKADESGKTLPSEHWEPLFSAACPALEGAFCERCAAMQSGHGHLNKVGWLLDHGLHDRTVYVLLTGETPILVIFIL